MTANSNSNGNRDGNSPDFHKHAEALHGLEMKQAKCEEKQDGRYREVCEVKERVEVVRKEALEEMGNTRKLFLEEVRAIRKEFADGLKDATKVNEQRWTQITTVELPAIKKDITVSAVKTGVVFTIIMAIILAVASRIVDKI